MCVWKLTHQETKIQNVNESVMHEQEEKLQQEILNDAHRKQERTLQRARRDVEKALLNVKKRQDDSRQTRLQAAEHLAKDKARAIKASIEQEIRRQWLLLREKQLDDVFAAVLSQLESGSGFDQDESLRQLAGEAVTALGEGEIVVELATKDKDKLTSAQIADVVKALPNGQNTKIDVEVKENPDMRRGIIVTSKNGRKQFNNTYATRLYRMKNQLRASVCNNIPASLSQVDVKGKDAEDA